MPATIDTTTGAVLFDYQVWIERFPEFQTLSQGTAEAYWDEAGLYLNNTGLSIVKDPDRRGMILNLITAHIAKIYAAVPLPSGGVSAPSGVVGRINSASEGSVSVSTDLGTDQRSAAWWNQTPYGLSAWKALAPYRMARYLPPPTYGYSPWVRF